MINETYYFEPLFHRWQNHIWSSDYGLFEFKNQNDITFNTKYVKLEDVVPNFSEGFFNSWKEVVDNWKELFNNSEGLIVDNKVLGENCSINELIGSYFAQKKVNDCHKNKEKYVKYLEDNKHLYSIIEYGNFGFINSVDYLPDEFKSDLENKYYSIKENLYKDIESTLITPYRRIYGDSLVIFMDFFEEVKAFWKERYPDAIKVLIKRNSLKRFWGVTDINPDMDYYFFSKAGMIESQFQNTSVEYFFLFKDGTVKGFM
jgi:hypothetical protein